VYEARNKLQNLCGFERHGYTGPDFIKYLISVAEGNIGEHNIREATTKGMLLVARYSKLIMHQAGVNFTNVLRSAFTRSDPESAKNSQAASLFFVLLGSGHVKAVLKTLAKVTPYGMCSICIVCISLFQ